MQSTPLAFACGIAEPDGADAILAQHIQMLARSGNGLPARATDCSVEDAAEGAQIHCLVCGLLMVNDLDLLGHITNFVDRHRDMGNQPLADLADEHVAVDLCNISRGLLIIDEEHRFGVRHKEQMKALRAEVDVLTLTATPIPRTLGMALEGIRDLSVIATAPQRRLAIKTFVRNEGNGVIREAVLRELKRGGQCYFLHNDVATIENRRAQLEELLPEARIAVAHGQMPERDLERVMSDFYHKRFKVWRYSDVGQLQFDHRFDHRAIMPTIPILAMVSTLCASAVVWLDGTVPSIYATIVVCLRVKQHVRCAHVSQRFGNKVLTHLVLVLVVIHQHHEFKFSGNFY